MKETFEHAGFRVTIENDEFSDTPGDWSDDVILVHFHRQCTVEHKSAPVQSLAELRDWHDRDEWETFLVSAYIHSGVVLALAGSIADQRFPDRQWDVSHVGAVFVKKNDRHWGKGEDGTVNYRKIAEALISDWNTYLSGDVWQYKIEKPVSCSHCGNTEYEILDSCSGFYGYEAVLIEAKDSAESYALRGVDVSDGGRHGAK